MDGGKVPTMKDGWFMKDGVKIVHKMQLDDEKKTQKGLKTILKERGLWLENGMKKAEAVALLAKQPDFKEVLPILKTVLRDFNDDKVYLELLPICHPEFNFIEMIWGWVKARLRKESDYSRKSLNTLLPLFLDEVPISFFRKAARKSFRYIDAYDKGLTPDQVEFAVKKYRGHRGLPPSWKKEIDFFCLRKSLHRTLKQP